MNQIIEYLEQLDLSEVEAKLYLTLLKSGPLSVRELSKAVEIKRTTAYMHIDQLVEKGLVTKLVKKSQKLIAANEPGETLKSLAEKKLELAKKTNEQFPEMLKRINHNTLQADNINEAEIRYYKGKAGVKKIYNEVLQAKEQRSYVDPTKIVEVFPENFLLFDKALTTDLNVKMYELFQNYSNEKTKTYLKFVTRHKNYFYKILPQGVELTSQDILIYDNKVAIISFSDEINGVVLKNQDLYNNFKALFDLMWKLLPKVQK